MSNTALIIQPGETELTVSDLARRRFEQMLASSVTAAVCAGADNLIVSWSAAAETLFGFRAADAVGQLLTIIVPPHLRAAHEAGIRRAAHAGHARLAGRSIEVLALHADGSEIPVDLSLAMWFEAGKPMFGALLRDIADRHSATQRLRHLANCDTLTSLPNRNALHERLATDVAKGACSLLLLDLDGFKHVNDSLGHSVGDALLTAVGARLTAAVQPNEMVARLGGDEFAVLLPACADARKVDALAARVFRALEKPFELVGQSIYVGTSIGIAMSPKDAVDVEQLLSSADLALYSAKNNGGNVHTFFSRSMQSNAEQRRRLNSELRQALANDEFALWFQPQVRLTDGSLSGFEALLRWHHPVRGILAPKSFIDVLEESAIAEDVGDWIIEQSCAAAAAWTRDGAGAMRIGVNLFAAQLRSGRLFATVTSALQRHGLSPDQLELELTENTVIRQNKQSTKALRRLKALGVGIALDDFGTGFASLSLLQNFPLTRLKIDRSFVSRIARRVGDATRSSGLSSRSQVASIYP